MKLTKSQLKQIIKEEILVLELFDTGSAGEGVGCDDKIKPVQEEDDKWIQKAVPKDDPDRGKFSAAAKRAGMSTCAYARKVVKDPKASKKQKDRAQFALNTGCKDK